MHLPGRGTGQHRTQNKALEGRHANIGEADGSNGGQNICSKSGVLELIQQNQQVHQLLWWLWLAQFYHKRREQKFIDINP